MKPNPTRFGPASWIIGAGLVAALAGVFLWPPAPKAKTSAAPAATKTLAPLTAQQAHLEYVPTPIGAGLGEIDRPIVTHLAIVDLDGDGLPDVLYCDARKNTVRWIRQAPRGVYTEQIIGEDIPAPAHVATADVNGTGRLDVLVASMGQITPNNDRIGSVVVLENLDGEQGRLVLREPHREHAVRLHPHAGRGL